MLRLTEIRLPIHHSEEDLRRAILNRLAISPDDLLEYVLFRRNHDARKKRDIDFVYTVDVSVRNEQALLEKLPPHRHIKPAPDMRYRFVAHAHGTPPRPVIAGCGPCGLFAALILAQSGFKPIILERGKMVRERARDTFTFWRQGDLDPESNVQFGEGGAGTFSDGKLHTQIKDPGHYGRKVLTELVSAGAPPEILYLGKPHVGTFRLVKVVEQLRQTIQSLGGEFRFQSRVDKLDIADGRIRGIMTAHGEYVACGHL
ncbi:MAG: hypothetical protein LBK01_00995, partial [Burkholderiaceae bacterium]|nr:hypothetical protein [Burkholderiaceae bacterium]